MPIKYIIAINFEATLYSSMYPTHEPWFPEIINFAAVLLNLQSGRIENTFQTLVQPDYFPYLANPAVQKMRVHPDVFRRLPTLVMVLHDFSKWLAAMCVQRNVKLPTSKRIRAYKDYAILCAWSNMDLGYYLLNECSRKGVRLCAEMRHWMDAQKVARKTVAHLPEHLHAAAMALGTPCSRPPCNALQDAKTLAYLVLKLKSYQAYFMDLEGY